MIHQPSQAGARPLPFWRRYLFSTDHKVIGIQYAVTAMVFLVVGFVLMMLMRWQLAYPGQPIPLVGGLLGERNAPGGIMLPEFYNQLGAMHGTIMIFLGVVPLAVGGFGNYVLPLQIGAPDMAFPRLNLLSYWAFAAGGVVMLVSFVVPGGAANSGWTSYPPLAGTSFFLPMTAHTVGRSRTYVGVYGALLFATIVTVGVAALHLSVPAAVALALVIATAKASLVALYFMHLKWEGRLIYGAVALTLFLFAALMGLLVASAYDQVGSVL